MDDLKISQDLDKIISENDIVLVQYSTNLCTACHSIKHKINLYSKENPDIKAIYVDIADFQEISSQKGVFTAPTLELYVEGSLTVRKSGYFSLDEVFKRIEKYKSIRG